MPLVSDPLDIHTSHITTLKERDLLQMLDSLELSYKKISPNKFRITFPVDIGEHRSTFSTQASIREHPKCLDLDTALAMSDFEKLGFSAAEVLHRVNEWNFQQSRFITASIDPDGDVRLRLSTVVQFGTSYNHVSTMIMGFCNVWAAQCIKFIFCFSD
ncbi:MAG: hypothetical protein AAFY72_05425 [Cyanobacteria bacterium J06649_4]